MGLNTIIIGGRLTRDPEMRYTQTNTPVASFTLAVDRDYASGGDRKADFIDCVAWRHTAEFVSKYFQKGSGAVIKGRLQLRDWTDKEGNKRRSAEVVCESVYFSGNKAEVGTVQIPRESELTELPGSGYDNPFMQVKQSSFAELEDEDGELPF